jgi:hypothetical protein
MKEIVAGMAIEIRDRMLQACHSIRFNLEFDSNEIDESDPQKEKHPQQRISTSCGLTIDSTDDDENAHDSIHVNRESHSNEIDQSDLQQEKHFERRISMFHGIMIDRRDDHEKASDSIRSVSILIQMKSIKVIETPKNTQNKEFEQFVE